MQFVVLYSVMPMPMPCSEWLEGMTKCIRAFLKKRSSYFQQCNFQHSHNAVPLTPRACAPTYDDCANVTGNCGFMIHDGT